MDEIVVKKGNGDEKEQKMNQGVSRQEVQKQPKPKSLYGWKQWRAYLKHSLEKGIVPQQIIIGYLKEKRELS